MRSRHLIVRTRRLRLGVQPRRPSPMRPPPEVWMLTEVDFVRVSPEKFLQRCVLQLGTEGNPPDPRWSYAIAALLRRTRRRELPAAALRILIARLLRSLRAGWVRVASRPRLPARSPPAAADPLAFGIPRHGPPTRRRVEEVPAVT